MRVVSQSYLNMYITEANRQTARLEYDLAEMRREAARLRAERDRLRAALVAEEEVRTAPTIQTARAAREKADKLRAEALPKHAD